MFLHIAGTGATALKVANECDRQATSYAFGNKALQEAQSDAIVIHIGRRERLLQALEFCQRTATPLIHAASGLDDWLPSDPKCIIVRAPSLAIKVVKFLELAPVLKEVAHQHGTTTRIVVSHQLTKKTPPGTAREIANLLGIDEKAIHVLTSEDDQRQLGVAPEHLGRHSMHIVRFTDPECTIEMKIKLHGLGAYARGAVTIARALDRKRNLQPGYYSVPYILDGKEKPTVPG